MSVTNQQQVQQISYLEEPELCPSHINTLRNLAVQIPLASAFCPLTTNLFYLVRAV